jgi:hypothetical protein
MLGLNSGLIGVRRVPATGSAPGVWVPNEQVLAKRAAIWPLPAETTDPDFASVSLLLHMDGSNGSTTFTDSSSSALSITANGNAQISTAQSKFGGASGLFDGSGDYLSFSALSIGSSTDATLECWVYLNSVADAGIFGTTFSGNWQLLAVLSGKLYAYWNGVEVEEATASITTNTWHHVAITRASGTLRLFVNGTLRASASSSTSNTTVSRIANTTYRGDLNGYVDDARVTIGVARYTASFTAPTAAFPNS